jgi:hypothetical protein
VECVSITEIPREPQIGFGIPTRLYDTFATRPIATLNLYSVLKEAVMIDFYFIELAEVVLSSLLSLLHVDAQIASALLFW